MANAIPSSFYVYVNSVVGGSPTVGTKQFSLRLLTGNSLLPPINPDQPYDEPQFGVVQFGSAVQVGNYFGTSSEEYKRALQYFSYVDPQFNSKPDFIQYSRWVDVACPPIIYPNQDNGSVLANWTDIDDGAFTLTMGGFTFNITGLDFTAAGSLAAVAGIVEDAIQAQTGGGAVWTSATVTYSSSYGGFILTGGANDVVTNPVIVSVSSTGTDITGLTYLGWLPQEQEAGQNIIAGAIWASGAAVETITQTIDNSISVSTNFVSLDFLDNLNLTLSESQEAAAYANTVQTFVYLQVLNSSNAFTWQTALKNYGYTGLTLGGLVSTQIGTLANTSVTVTGLNSTDKLVVGQPVSGNHVAAGTVIATIASATSITLSIAATGSGVSTLSFSLIDYPEQLPAAIAASTQYNAINSVVNYMYKSLAALTPSVSTASAASAYDAVSINYYGVTQVNGQYDAFYQRGFLQGPSTAPLDMGVCYNEIWLKDQMTVAFYNLLRGTNRVGADPQGKSMLLSTGQGVIKRALANSGNGVISVGKTLTEDQKVAITSKSGDPNAWHQVQDSGYWFDVVIALNEDDPPVYIATYTLIYSKADSIRMIIGEDFLI